MPAGRLILVRSSRKGGSHSQTKRVEPSFKSPDLSAAIHAYALRKLLDLAAKKPNMNIGCTRRLCSI